MSVFSQELKAARVSMGHKTAKAFYLWLVEKGVGCNYSYYMQLENGGLPSEKVAQELASAIKGEWTDRLILAYCRSLFPKNTYLFPEASPVKEAPENYTPGGQKELSPKQVAAIGTSEATYHLFLLSTLARKSIQTRDLEKWYSAKALSAALKTLEGAALIHREGAEFEALAVEMKFPEAFNETLKKLYAQFDLWDESFGQQFALDFILNKMIIRRVSGRYLSIIRSQLEVLFELVRSSDETDTRFNDKTLQLKVVLRQGNLPG